MRCGRNRRWRPNRSQLPTHEALPHIALASYPRSGNTLLRSLIEQRCHTITGSDMKVDEHAKTLFMARRLRSLGLQGEGISDDRVWMVKTHFPERTGPVFAPVRMHGAIVLVRNPCDAVDSLWNMRRTKSHTRSVWPLAYTLARDEWQSQLRAEAKKWAAFLQFWQQTDACFVRFEDLLNVQRREPTLRRIAQYLCDMVPESQRPSARAVLADLLDGQTTTSADGGPLASVAAKSVYIPRRGTVGHSLRHFGADDRAAVAEGCGGLMRAFGYNDDPRSDSFSNDVVAADAPLPPAWPQTEDSVLIHGAPAVMCLANGIMINGDASMTRPGLSEAREAGGTTAQ